MQVGGLLVRFRVELEPPGVALAHRIRMVVPDVDGSADRPVRDRHDDREAKARSVVHGLDHEEEAL